MDTVTHIPLHRLALAGVPVIAVVWLLYHWGGEARTALYAFARMLVQLLLIGYLLAFIFEADNAALPMAVLAVMITAASWISLRLVPGKKTTLLGPALVSVGVGGGITLAVVTQAVLDLQPWFRPQYLVPLAGMVFANCMNSIALAAERMFAEAEAAKPYPEARRIALRTALMPITNSLFAVGLVSLPGMMTGQILAGISPTMAVRYQIMVMAMLFSASGLSAALFLYGLRNVYEPAAKAPTPEPTQPNHAVD